MSRKSPRPGRNRERGLPVSGLRHEGGLLLVNPLIHDFAAYNLWLRPAGLIGIYGYLKSMGLEARYADALFPSRAEAEKHRLSWPESRKYHTGKFPEALIEKPPAYGKIPRRYRRFGLPPELFMERLAGFPRPRYILMTSGMTYWYPGVIETIGLCRKVFPGVPAVLGGVYATLCPEHAGSRSGADSVITGPWRASLPRFLREMGMKPVNSRPLPPPGDASCEAELYPDSRFGVVRTGEGCPFNCGYCASSALSDGFFKRPPGEVYAEIEKKAAAGFEDIAFYDDALLAGAEECLVPLLELIRKGGLKCRFHTPNGLHARYMTMRIAELFMGCGFRTVRLSFDRGAEAGGEKVSAGHLERAAGFLRRAGYDPGGLGVYTLAGLRGQTDSDLLETFNIIKGAGMKVKPAFYSPVPGTAQFEEDCLELPGLMDEPLLHNPAAAAVWGFSQGRCERLKALAAEN